MYLNSHAIKNTYSKSQSNKEINKGKNLNTAVKMRECLSDLSL